MNLKQDLSLLHSSWTLVRVGSIFMRLEDYQHERIYTDTSFTPSSTKIITPGSFLIFVKLRRTEGIVEFIYNGGLHYCVFPSLNSFIYIA